MPRPTARPRPTALHRPTAAQFAYGSCTVIFSTLAMLLLSETTSGLGVVVIVLAALLLGLLVALTVPLPKPEPVAAESPEPERVPAHRATASVGSAEPARGPAGR
ncbi:hypothetical protein ACFV6E_09590 [Streptomyces sp. NPDC059785]|uniref:hypothetical protein n=1 Tax=unclassified Streptomyces TaxID=2593676 RepID=UPI00365E1407